MIAVIATAEYAQATPLQAGQGGYTSGRFLRVVLMILRLLVAAKHAAQVAFVCVFISFVFFQIF